jgi:hypothetical protein
VCESLHILVITSGVVSYTTFESYTLENNLGEQTYFYLSREMYGSNIAHCLIECSQRFLLATQGTTAFAKIQ